MPGSRSDSHCGFPGPDSVREGMPLHFSDARQPAPNGIVAKVERLYAEAHYGRKRERSGKNRPHALPAPAKSRKNEGDAIGVPFSPELT